MTIFLMVLKKLIKEKLSAASSTLTTQSKSYGYNKQLSVDQKDILDELEEVILRFDGTGDDKKDSETIIKAMQTHREKLQIAREKHGQSRDKGNTLECISNLIFHTNGFHSKLAEFQFPLLNKKYTETPEGIIYYHATYYFGEELFTPLANIDLKIRGKKEERLRVRLQSLSELIKPTHTLAERKERATQVLSDLAKDNETVIKKDESTIALPGVSFWGIQLTVPSEWFGASLGRFGQQFNHAVRKIKEMTPETFKPETDAAPSTNHESPPVYHNSNNTESDSPPPVRKVKKEDPPAEEKSEPVDEEGTAEKVSNAM